MPGNTDGIPATLWLWMNKGQYRRNWKQTSLTFFNAVIVALAVTMVRFVSLACLVCPKEVEPKTGNDLVLIIHSVHSVCGTRSMDCLMEPAASPSPAQITGTMLDQLSKWSAHIASALS